MTGKEIVQQFLDTSVRRDCNGCPSRDFTVIEFDEKDHTGMIECGGCGWRYTMTEAEFRRACDAVLSAEKSKAPSYIGGM